MQLDRNKISVIDWLVYEEAHRAEAIHQANALIRSFLGTSLIIGTTVLSTTMWLLSIHACMPLCSTAARKYLAADEVFHKIPPDSIEIVTRNWKAEVHVHNQLAKWLLSVSIQAGEEPYPVKLKNDIKEYLCIKAYLVNSQIKKIL